MAKQTTHMKIHYFSLLTGSLLSVAAMAQEAGLGAVATYLVISGSPAPAERAAITASIAFLAILLDRQAITMHALAVAAFVVLLLQPEAIVTPGFQMSFSATAALVALVEAWPVRPREISAPWPILLVQRVGAWLGIAVMAKWVKERRAKPGRKDAKS